MVLYVAFFDMIYTAEYVFHVYVKHFISFLVQTQAPLLHIYQWMAGYLL